MILSAVKNNAFEVSLQTPASLEIFVLLEYWVEPGGDQTITIEVYDEETGEDIEDAYVLVDASLESFEGYTDFGGEVSFLGQ